MASKTYGELGVAYAIEERGHDWISVYVHTDDKGMRDHLRVFADNTRKPSELLPHYGAWHRSSNSAQHWLARVMEDHRRFFEADRVKFILT